MRELKLKQEKEDAMTKKNASATTDGLARRDVLKLGASGAAAAGLAAGLGATEATAAEVAPKASTYRETEHVKTYYELARF